MSGWIGVDLDGTLAEYGGWVGPDHIGKPVPLMLERVQGWLKRGIEVRIFTARVACGENEDPGPSEEARQHIMSWLVRNDLPALRITNKKDYGMVECWDDRAIQVVPNTGERVDGKEDCATL